MRWVMKRLRSAIRAVFATLAMAGLMAGSMTAALSAHAQERVSFASLDRPVQLTGFLFEVPGAAKAPAVVLLHGCGGVYNKSGALNQRSIDYARLLNEHGLHALVLDSLTPRGERELCTQRTGQRNVTQVNRRLDALAAVDWLAQRERVDAQRIGLLGWSNGGSTVLATINTRWAQTGAARAARVPAFAVAFYPGCAEELKRGFRTEVPLLVLVGEADDWTPATACHELARAGVGRAVQIEGYAGAYHGFDSAGPVVLRRDVPNGVHPGEGVHVGGNPAAHDASRARMLQFLADPLTPR